MSELYTKWWGNFAVAQGEQRTLRCADLYLQLQFLPNQWLLGYEWQQDINQFQPVLEAAFDDTTPAPENEQRFVFAELPTTLTLQPALADRPVVCRPVVSVSLLPFQEVTLFVCLPLWVKLKTGESEQTLLDIPTVSVCDSWLALTPARVSSATRLRSVSSLMSSQYPITRPEPRLKSESRISLLKC